MDAPVYFTKPADFRRWLTAHHLDHDVLVVGYFKRGSGMPSLTWPESVEEALCFGWIDGVRQSVDGERYTVRFTKRRPTSIWSAKNIATVEALIAARKMKPPGLRAFEARDENRSRVYSFEQKQASALEPADAQRFRANKAAWAHFERQAPWYQRAALHWVTSAKRAETRTSRLATLISDSAAGLHVKPLRRREGKK